MWLLRVYNIFPHYLKKARLKKLLKTKCVFSFSLQLLSETSFILRRTEQDILKNICQSSCKVPVLMKLEFSRQMRKILNIKFHKNTSSGSRVVPCEQMDGQTDMSKLTVFFRDFARAPKNEHRRALQHILLNEILQTFLSRACKAVVDPTLILQYKSTL